MLTRSDEELSIVCPAEQVPGDVRKESGFRALRVRGPLDFGATGVVSSIAAPLAQAKVAILVMSTFDTDYLFVREHDLPRARRALSDAGIGCIEPSAGTSVG